MGRYVRNSRIKTIRNFPKCSRTVIFSKKTLIAGVYQLLCSASDLVSKQLISYKNVEL